MALKEGESFFVVCTKNGYIVTVNRHPPQAGQWQVPVVAEQYVAYTVTDLTEIIKGIEEENK